MILPQLHFAWLIFHATPKHGQHLPPAFMWENVIEFWLIRATMPTYTIEDIKKLCRGHTLYFSVKQKYTITSHRIFSFHFRTIILRAEKLAAMLTLSCRGQPWGYYWEVYCHYAYRHHTASLLIIEFRRLVVWATLLATRYWFYIKEIYILLYEDIYFCHYWAFYYLLVSYYFEGVYFTGSRSVPLLFIYASYLARLIGISTALVAPLFLRLLWPFRQCHSFFFDEGCRKAKKRLSFLHYLH